eukprot:TRINITY_DN4106_c0_g1_i3.p1 TRINITY_DN4106_c0_g1~~TRINITY_DN4106_c0_g1_i3.p1  ORF type:complete len:623 (+),score=47.94 TRINITY_DN4106_c0_g1_i3:121-1869(+)
MKVHPEQTELTLEAESELNTYQQESDEFWGQRRLKPVANSFHLCGWGVAGVIAGEFMGWNTGLRAGFGGYLISTSMMTFAYLVLVLCLSELASALPFDGGAYGFCRAILGQTVGCFVGCAESLEYVMTTMYTIASLGFLITDSLQLDPKWEPLYWLFFYCVYMCIGVVGGKFIWNTQIFLAVINCFLLVFYWFGTLSTTNFSWFAAERTQYGRSTTPTLVVLANSSMPVGGSSDSGSGMWFVGGPMVFLQSLSNALWWYIGIEYLPLGAGEATQPTRMVPRGIISAFVILVICVFATLFSCSAQPPGLDTLQNAEFPLTQGFAQIFGVSTSHPSFNRFNFFTFPSLIATSLGFFLAYGRQIYAMSRSGFFPAFLSTTHPTTFQPIFALLAGSIIGFVVCFTTLAIPRARLQTFIFNVSNMCACVEFMIFLTCFIIFNVKYSAVKREYVNPLGVPGAVIGFIIWFMAFTGCLMMEDSWWALIALAFWFGSFLTYFFLYSRYHLTISPEEQRALFELYSVQYVMKKNQLAIQPKHKQSFDHRESQSTNQAKQSRVSNNGSTVGSSTQLLSDHSPGVVSPHTPLA